MQTVRDQTAGTLQKLAIFLAKRVQLVALHIQHAKDALMLVVPHWDNDLRARRMKRGQMARIFVHVADNNRFARVQRRAAKPLRNGKTRVSRRLIACACENHEFIFDDFVNRQPPVIARCANHLHELFHSFAGATAGQRKRPDLLQLFARGFLHSRGSNLAQKETKREHDFNFLSLAGR